MILRSSALRHGRQVVSSPVRQSCLRALSTGGRHPPLPTAFADPSSAPPTQDAAATPTSVPAEASEQSTWQPKAGASVVAMWKAQQRVELDESIAHRYREKKLVDKAIGKMGSVVTKRFDPGSLLRDPPRPEDVTLELLMASQTHMGHHVSLWNPANQRYIYGVRANIHIISLEETAAALRRAARVVEEIAYLGGLILFVGNRRGQMEITARAAELAGACHLFTKWVPGTITNRDQILGREELQVLDEKDKPAPGFERYLLERRPVMPELVVVLNPLENFTLLHECAQENIPTIGLIDTNADPTKVTYIIPGNDDSLRSVSVIAGVLGRAGEQGQKRRKADADRGLCTWRNQPEIDEWVSESAARAEAEAPPTEAEEGKGEENEARDEYGDGGGGGGGGGRGVGGRRAANSGSFPVPAMGEGNMMRSIM